jgi:hypothetical protein
MNLLLAKYGCAFEEDVPIVFITANVRNVEEDFRYYYVEKFGVKTIAVSSENGGAAFDSALNNSGMSGNFYLIKPDRSVIGDSEQIALEDDIIGAGIKPHQYTIKDTVSPKISFITPEPNWLYTSEDIIIVSWEITDNNFVIKSVLEFWSDDNKKWVFLDSLDGFTENYYWQIPIIKKSYLCSLRITSYDLAGNSGTAVSKAFTVTTSVIPSNRIKPSVGNASIVHVDRMYMLKLSNESICDAVLLDLNGKVLSNFIVVANKWFTLPETGASKSIYLQIKKYGVKYSIRKLK